MASVPPISEVASPSEDTVTSMREPVPMKAGNSLVTVTAATFLLREFCERMLTPMRSSIDCIDCSVKGELRMESPVPCRPMTRP